MGRKRDQELLHEATQDRSLPAVELTDDEADGLWLALQQVRDGQLHGTGAARRVIDSVVRR